MGSFSRGEVRKREEKEEERRKKGEREEKDKRGEKYNMVGKNRKMRSKKR